MRHIHFSVKTILIATALLAAAFGALESDSALVASLVFTLNLGLLGVATVGAMVSRGNQRVFWLGFATFGWVYSFVAFGWLSSARISPNYVWMGNTYQQNGVRTDRSNLATVMLLDLYATVRKSTSVGTRVMAEWRGAGYWAATIREVKDGRYRVAWDDGSPDEWVAPHQIQPGTRDIERVGHSIFSPLIGLLGGVICWYLFADRRIDSPLPNVAPPSAAAPPPTVLSTTSAPAPS